MIRSLFPLPLLLLAGCAPDVPVSLIDDLGEIDTPSEITLDQVEFDNPCQEEIEFERCLSLEDIDAGIACDSETAILHFDADVWTLNADLASYNIDTFSDLPDGEIVWAWDRRNKPKWAECGCPSGCIANLCNWERNEDNSYSCTGDCRGTHCSTCTVELRDAEEIAPATN